MSIPAAYGLPVMLSGHTAGVSRGVQRHTSCITRRSSIEQSSPRISSHNSSPLFSIQQLANVSLIYTMLSLYLFTALRMSHCSVLAPAQNEFLKARHW